MPRRVPGRRVRQTATGREANWQLCLGPVSFLDFLGVPESRDGARCGGSGVAPSPD